MLCVPPAPPSPCRNDTIAGPLGRRGDRVGGPYYMHRDDLRKLAPQWLNYTHIMRNDTEVRQPCKPDRQTRQIDQVLASQPASSSGGSDAACTPVY